MYRWISQLNYPIAVCEQPTRIRKPDILDRPALLQEQPRDEHVVLVPSGMPRNEQVAQLTVQDGFCLSGRRSGHAPSHFICECVSMTADLSLLVEAVSSLFGLAIVKVTARTMMPRNTRSTSFALQGPAPGRLAAVVPKPVPNSSSRHTPPACFWHGTGLQTATGGTGYAD